MGTLVSSFSIVVGVGDNVVNFIVNNKKNSQVFMFLVGKYYKYHSLVDD